MPQYHPNKLTGATLSCGYIAKTVRQTSRRYHQKLKKSNSRFLGGAFEVSTSAPAAFSTLCTNPPRLMGLSALRSSSPPPPPPAVPLTPIQSILALVSFFAVSPGIPP